MSDDAGFLERWFDRCAEFWKRLDHCFSGRPMQLIGYVIAALMVVAVITYSAATSTQNKADIGEVKSIFCRADKRVRNDPVERAANIKRCQALLSRLLEHPTTQQAHELREIIKKGGP